MEDTGGRILDAALEAFATEGYANTTMDRIAEKAGVAKGTLYWHFKGKEEILFAGIDREHEKIEVFAGKVLRLDSPSLDSLERIFDIKCWINDDMQRFHKVMLSIWTDVSIGVREKIEERMKRDHVHFVRMMVNLLDGININGCVAGVTNHAMASLIHASMSGIFMHLLNDPGGTDLDDLGNAMKQVYLKRIAENAGGN